jgi:hypothetical protein
MDAQDNPILLEVGFYMDDSVRENDILQEGKKRKKIKI